MKRLQYILLTMILFPLMGMVSSCSEESAEEDEFGNWQERNDQAISQWASNSAYRKILNFSKLNTSTTLTVNDYIYVQELESGVGTASPIYTDTVRVAYRGHYIPTKNHPEGYVFDQSFLGDFSWDTISTIDSRAGSFVDGFTTAVMNMHVGDHWRVYIPYTLAYGLESASSSIPDASALVFEVALVDFWHPGETRPDFK